MVNSNSLLYVFRSQHFRSSKFVTNRPKKHETSTYIKGTEQQNKRREGNETARKAIYSTANHPSRFILKGKRSGRDDTYTCAHPKPMQSSYPVASPLPQIDVAPLRAYQPVLNRVQNHPSPRVEDILPPIDSPSKPQSNPHFVCAFSPSCRWY